MLLTDAMIGFLEFDSFLHSLFEPWVLEESLVVTYGEDPIDIDRGSILTKHKRQTVFIAQNSKCNHIKISLHYSMVSIIIISLTDSIFKLGRNIIRRWSSLI